VAGLTDRLDRRGFLRGAMMGTAIATAAPAFEVTPARQAAAGAGVSLREKCFGCIAGCFVGSAMGVPVETWTYQRIEETYGTLDKLLPYVQGGWKREAGTTEDGVERQKPIITAIIEKKGRVTADDIARIWARDIKPDAPKILQAHDEDKMVAMAKAGIPATDFGKYVDFSGLITVARSFQPIGLINAGDIPTAIADLHTIGQMYMAAGNRGLHWGAVTVAAIAAATKPGATVDSVIGAIYDNCDKRVLRELDAGLKIAAKCADFKELRKAFENVDRYNGRGMMYATSYANEVVTKGVCMFKLTNGNLKDALIGAVNMGRDTDCLTAVAGGIAGALSGAASLPPEWIKQVDYATSINPYTNSKKTIRESSDGIYEAFRAKLQRMKTYFTEMEEA